MVTSVASWAEHTIWWHVYPLGFTGAEKTALAPGEPVRHRLRQLDGWLDYAVELGCSGLLLGPIFAAETHGYDTVDHFEIDPGSAIRRTSTIWSPKPAGVACASFSTGCSTMSAVRSRRLRPRSPAGRARPPPDGSGAIRTAASMRRSRVTTSLSPWITRSPR